MLPYTRYHKDFHHTCSMLLHNLVKVENRKCYRICTKLKAITLSILKLSLVYYFLGHSVYPCHVLKDKH